MLAVNNVMTYELPDGVIVHPVNIAYVALRNNGDIRIIFTGAKNHFYDVSFDTEYQRVEFVKNFRLSCDAGKQIFQKSTA